MISELTSWSAECWVCRWRYPVDHVQGGRATFIKILRREGWWFAVDSGAMSDEIRCPKCASASGDGDA